MTAPPEPSAAAATPLVADGIPNAPIADAARTPRPAAKPTVQPPMPVRRHPLSPKKLLLTKWTAVSPMRKEKHFVVTHVVEPDPPSVRVEWVDLEAVHSGRSTRLAWRDLTDPQRWRRGWV